MITSRIYHKNIVRRAAEGLGDGTVYAKGTGATPEPDIKRFSLSGLSIIADISDGADVFETYFLYFPDSGNAYNITAYDQVNDRVYVKELPRAADEGAFEIRKRLWCGYEQPLNNIIDLSDGKLRTLWKSDGPGGQPIIRVFAPNLITDGGFEAQAVGNPQSPWEYQPDWTISATSPLLGSRMAVYTKGTLNRFLLQRPDKPIKKGKTYRLLFKAQALFANPTSGVAYVKIEQSDDPWTKILLPQYFVPTTTATWFQYTFTAPFSSDRYWVVFWALGADGTWGSCTGLNLDEVYLYEDIPADRLIVAGHNWNGISISGLNGCYCDPQRTGFTWNVDSSTNIFSGGELIDGSETILKTFAEHRYPVWHIHLGATGVLQHEAAYMFIGSAMSFDKQPTAHDPDARAATGRMNESAVGRRVFYPAAHKGGPINLNLSKINSGFYTKLKDFWAECGRDRFPFFYCFDEQTAPEDIKLVRCESDFLFAYNPVLRDGTLKLTEEL